MAALAAEIGRRDSEAQAPFVAGMAEYAGAVEELLKRSGARKGAETRRRALTLMAALVGGMTLARASAAADPDFSAEILAALRAELQSLVS